MIRQFRARATLVACGVFALLSGCAAPRPEHDAATQAADDDAWQSEFHVDSSDWVSHGSNGYFVLEPGYRMVLAREGAREKLLTITVLDQTQTIDGVQTRVVEERETVAGVPREISRNYYAMSSRTNDVYYFGEDVDIYKDGQIAAHEGGWRAGVDGARFGLAMPGTIRVGSRAYQEHAPGTAMDRFEITATEQSIDTPAGRLEHCLQIGETTPLEPGGAEFKLYAPGIGLVQDEDLLLVSYGYAPAPS